MHSLRLTIVLASLCCASAAARAAQPQSPPEPAASTPGLQPGLRERQWRIMPAGDSITDGGKTFSNYRYPL